jgi:small-conductance mechanosensitive channel
MSNGDSERMIQFSNKIDTGQIIMIVGLVVSAFTAFQTFDKRLVILEENIKYQSQRDRDQDQKISETDKNIKESSTDLRSRLDIIKEQIIKVERDRLK